LWTETAKQKFMIGEKILELRNARGWNQEELSRRTGISRVVISRYENGTIPYQRNLRKILSAFKLPADYFYKLSVANSEPNRHSDDSALNQNIEDLLKFSKSDQQIVVSVIESIKRNKLHSEKGRKKIASAKSVN